MTRVFFVLGCLFAMLSVAGGAFGSHLLRDRLDTRMLEVFETAVRYQMYHSLALLGVAGFLSRSPSALATVSGWLFVVGILVFSGSLYVLTISGQRWLGAITPLGGTAFLAGWLCLAISALVQK